MMALWSSMCFVKTLFPKLYRYAAVFDHTMQIVHVIYCTCPLLHPRISFSSAGAELQGKYNFQNAQITSKVNVTVMESQKCAHLLWLHRHDDMTDEALFRRGWLMHNAAKTGPI